MANNNLSHRKILLVIRDRRTYREVVSEYVGERIFGDSPELQHNLAKEFWKKQKQK